MNGSVLMAVLGVGVFVLGACSSQPKRQLSAAAGSRASSSSVDGVAAAGAAAPANDFGSPSGPVKASEPAGSGAASAGEPECGRQRFEVMRKPADLLLVLDRSGSMKDDVDGDSKGNPSKWDIVVPALKDVISATGATVHWGLELFPLGDGTGECTKDSYPGEIAVPVLPDNAPPVNAAIDKATPKGDGTPTSDAIDEAVKYLQTLKDDSRRYILLATDGEPSCAGTEKGGSKARPAAISAVTNAAAAGFNTFVVGIATTKDSASKTLTELAKAGGQAPASGYYLASTRDQLVDAVRQIAGSVASCRFPLASKPPNPEHVGVLIGSDKVSKDPAQHDGWNFTDADLSAVELFGPACERVKQSGAQSVNVVFGCKEDVLF